MPCARLAIVETPPSNELSELANSLRRTVEVSEQRLLGGCHDG